MINSLALTIEKQTSKRIRSRIGLIYLACSKTHKANLIEASRFMMILDRTPTPELASLINSVKVSSKGHISYTVQIARIPNKNAYDQYKHIIFR